MEQGRWRLMIVDDSNVMKRLIERSLSGKDVQVVGTASDGVEALDIFRLSRPQLVTMDLTMPQMDGLACIEALIRQDPNLRILVISALADKATAIEALQKGARGFLCKPFTEEEFDITFAELLEDD